MKFRPSTSGFTLVELIIGMTIFSIGLTGVYALLQTTMSTVRYSRDEIVVSWLLREQIDLVMNMRDSNIKNYIPFDSVLVESSTQTTFSSGYYMIENDFTNTGISINPSNGAITKNTLKLKKVDPFPVTDEVKWQKTQLRFDSVWRYIHSETTGTGTQFASYIIVSPLTVNGTEVKKDGKNQWWIIDARVLIKWNGSYREYDTKSMITDWIK